MQSHTFICLIITTCIILSVDINAFALASSSSKVTQQHPQCSSSYSDIRCGASIDDTTIDDNDDDTKQQRFILSPQTITSWYMNKLQTHELQTKFLSAAILALISDLFAQKIGHYMNPMISTKLDKRRMMAMFFDGLMFTGPLLHYVYELYEWILPTHDKEEGGTTSQSDKEKSSSSRKRLLAVTAHVLFDNFVMIFGYISLLMITTGVMEGRASGIPNELRYDFIPAVKVSMRTSVMGLAPIQLLSFHFLPMKLRVLAVNVLDVVWVTVMSYVTHRNRH